MGEGGNGKSTYLEAVRAFLGRGNTASLSLQKLESDRFAVARLVGKLANICPDLPSEHLAGTSMFKTITGGDTVTAEYKFHDSFDFVPYARLVFSANHPPQSSDSSQAFFDRWLVVPFNIRFRGEKTEIPRAVLDARLACPHELSGVLNKALMALKQMRAHFGFTESRCMKAAWDEFRATTDPLAVWLSEATIESPDAIVAKKDLIIAYNREVEHKGQPHMTATGFGLALRRLRPNLQDAQRTVAGEVTWVWLGIGLKSKEPKDANNGSHGSRGSRGSLYLNHTGDKKLSDKNSEKSSRQVEQDKGNRVNRVNSVNLPDNDEKGAESYSPSEIGESGRDTDSHSSVGNVSLSPDALGMTVDQALELWRQHGAPVIHLSQGVNCLDLSKLLSRTDVSLEYLEAVRTWLGKQQGGNGQC